MTVHEIIAEAKSRVDAAGGLKQVYFVGCGGSKAAIYPGYYLLKNEARSFGASTYTSNEFVHLVPKELDGHCIAVVCSLKATPESVEAVKVANAAGAVTLAMTGSMETGMAAVGQYVVVYSNGDDQVYSDSNGANALRIGFEILHQFENWAYYGEAMAAYGKIDALVAAGKQKAREDAGAWGRAYKDDPLFYILASGPSWGVAYSMGCCHFMEMQWKHAVVLHSGEYFHGPFETTGPELPVVLLMSVGRTRPLDERCLAFLKRYAGRYKVLDAAAFGVGSLGEHVAEYFNAVVMIPIERFYVSRMAEATGHSMDERRYMWKVEY